MVLRSALLASVAVAAAAENSFMQAHEAAVPAVQVQAASTKLVEVPAKVETLPAETLGLAAKAEKPTAKELKLAKKYIAANAGAGKYLKWLWWPAILYILFWQATICDDYFVKAIEAVVEIYHIPEDVAGATLMALGCNGPELFTNAVSIFIVHSDVGAGTIVGSEIFNLLCIVGASIIFCPVEPVVLEKYPFFRDSFFYGVSIIALYWALSDGGHIHSFQAYSLFFCCVIYATTVYSTKKIVAMIEGPEDTKKAPLVPKEPAGPHVDDIVEEVEHSAFMHVLSYLPERILGATMGWCDTRDADKKDMWLAEFCLAMCWLAVFSYLLCSSADAIGFAFNLSQAVLGLTLCAVGTSFPNWYASYLVAKKGRSSMAIANALGSNIQNVFLALALPWSIYTSVYGDYACNTDGIGVGVLWMGGTLVLVFSFAMFNGLKLYQWNGYLFTACYFGYVIQAVALSPTQAFPPALLHDM